jgi:hypothetical protein
MLWRQAAFPRSANPIVRESKRETSMNATRAAATAAAAGDVAPAAYDDRHGSPVAPLGAFSARCALEFVKRYAQKVWWRNLA